MSPFGPHNETGPALSMVVFELKHSGIKRNFHTGFAPTQCGYMNGVVLLSQLLHMKTINVLLHPWPPGCIGNNLRYKFKTVKSNQE